MHPDTSPALLRRSSTGERSSTACVRYAEFCLQDYSSKLPKDFTSRVGAASAENHETTCETPVEVRKKANATVAAIPAATAGDYSRDIPVIQAGMDRSLE